MLVPLLAAIVPVLVTALVGFLWVRSGRPLDMPTLTLLVADVGTPCLVFSTLAKTQIAPQAFLTVALATAVAILGFAAIGAAALSTARLRLRTYLPSVAFPNTGNLGLPLALYAFGSEGLSYAVVFFTIASILNYTLGQAMAAGAANWRAIARTPILYSTALGMAASYWRVALPPWLSNTTALIGGLTVPLMLLMLGASLAKLRVSALGRASFVSALRICAGAAVGLAVAAAFGLRGNARAALIMQCAMPVAVYNYLFAQMWNNQPDEVASLVVVSTLASVVTIPLLLLFLMV